MTNKKKPSKRQSKKTSNKKTSYKPFKLGIRELAPGEKNAEVAKVQDILKKLGYLAEDYEEQRLDEPTQKGLMRFQSFYKLEKTGAIDKLTVEKLESPRCGVFDPRLAIDAISFDALAANLKTGCVLPTPQNLTYTFTNLPSIARSPALGADIELVKGAFANAFNTWETDVLVHFVHDQGNDNATFKISWVTNGHGDNADFNGVGNDIAHAFFPPACPHPEFTGLCHFDDSEAWGLEDDLVNGQFDLETQALHEIGHLLGLRDSPDENSTMFRLYRGQRRELSDDARDAAQDVYGKRV